MQTPLLTLGHARIHRFTFKEAVERIIALTESGRGHFVVTPNADHVVRLEKDRDYQKIIATAHVVLADGMPLVWASRILRQPLPERITGADLLPALCAAAADADKSVFFLGGLLGEADEAARRLSLRYPGLKVAGTYCPPFGFENDPQENQCILKILNEKKPDLVFVGVGSPKQEKWIDRYRHEINAGVFLGVGMSIGFAAGTHKRAPVWMQKTGLEWVHRLCIEPGRLAKRYASDFYIFVIIAREWLRQRQAVEKTPE